ncbi:OmpA family protein [Brachybacterium sp. HMSC06H03]|uniref:OmpA family protein n=1 Tax=Brachybacterium sp. HMSC06H03 TaxID=1581127 RepID=UPI00114D0556|nr:OmpA family protein [Brachybacterium sp. HMSC06H03]
MTGWTRRRALAAAGAAAMLPVLAACTGGEDEAGAEGASDQGGEQAEPAPDPEEVVETRALASGYGEVELALHPLVRSGEHCVLTVDVTALSVPEGESGVTPSRFAADVSLHRSSATAEPWGALRLVDAGGAAIRLVATTADGRVVARASADPEEITVETLRLQLVYAAPEDGVETIGLLLPGWFVEALPVIEAEVPELGGEPERDVPLDELLGHVEQAPVIPLEGYARRLEGSVQTIESSEELEIRLAGDVLFDSSSYEIDGRADRVLDAAAASIGAYEGGVVTVIGHTDDVGGDADNQTLSEQRAAAVAEALSSRLDTSVYELRPEGRGESEPLVPNDSAGNRQLNRRVTLTLTAQKTTEIEVETDGQTLDFDPGPLGQGVEAPGPEGFDRAVDPEHEYRFSSPSARRVDGLLEVTVLAERIGGEGAGGYNKTVNVAAGGVFSYRGLSTGHSAKHVGFAPRLLVGATATYPLDYLLGESTTEGSLEWRIVSDPSGRDGAAVGDTLRFVALYRDIPGAETLDIEQPYVLGAVPFRFTDIPIEE